MTLRETLVVELHGYWHAGAGRSSGHHLDALCERDHEGLPILPGKQLKGLLRHVVRLAEAWGWLDDQPLTPGPATTHEEVLFGSQSNAVDRHRTHPGILLIESARLPEADRRSLTRSPDGLRDAAFGELFSTAINEDGTALAHSLRGTEVAIPCTLNAPMEAAPTALDPTRRQQQETYVRDQLAWRVLQAALPLLDHVGAHRSRGLGEARLRLESTTPEAGREA